MKHRISSTLVLTLLSTAHLLMAELPFKTGEKVAFLGDSTVVATGWDANPHIYAATGGAAHAPTWTLVDTLDKKPKPVVARRYLMAGM